MPSESGKLEGSLAKTSSSSGKAAQVGFCFRIAGHGSRFLRLVLTLARKNERKKKERKRNWRFRRGKKVLSDNKQPDGLAEPKRVESGGVCRAGSKKGQ